MATGGIRAGAELAEEMDVECSQKIAYEYL